MFRKKLPFKNLLFFILIIIMMGVACQLPVQQQADSPAEPDLEATIIALQTQMIEASKQTVVPDAEENQTPTESSEIKQPEWLRQQLYIP